MIPLSGPRALSMVAVLVLVLWSVPVGSQTSDPRVMTGTVVHGDQPVPEAVVELHRVSREGAGAVASTETDSAGRFSIEFDAAPPDDGFLVHFPTALFRGIRYFGPVVHRGEAAEDLRIEVYDTVSLASAQPVEVRRRDIVIVAHSGDGWEINELIRIHNPGGRTIVSSTGAPIWEQGLPRGAADVQIGEGDISADAVHLMDGRIVLATPLLPGDREIFLRYRLASGTSARAQFAVQQDTGLMSLLVRQPSPQFEVAGLGEGGEIEIEGDQFVRYAAEDLSAASAVAFEWEGRRESPVPPALAAGLIVGLVLLSTGIIALRRRPA